MPGTDYRIGIYYFTGVTWLGDTSNADFEITATSTVTSTVSFSVEFSEATQNFDAEADVVITETGTVAHTGVSVSGGPEDYTVDVTGVSGNGTMTLAVSTSSDVQDEAGNALVSSVTSLAATVVNSS